MKPEVKDKNCKKDINAVNNEKVLKSCHLFRKIIKKRI